MRGQGKLFINGRDAFVEYGVFVERYGYKGLIQQPSFKSLDYTEWSEEDGAEYDLSSPVLDTKSFSINFCITNIRYAEDLFDELSIGAYHTFEFMDLKKTYRLRMTSNGSFSSMVKLGKLALTFSDDFPMIPSADYFQYGNSYVKQRGYELDGLDFSQFGTYILKDTDDSIRKSANTKANLTVDTRSLAGVSYDANEVHFKTKDTTLKLLIDAADIDSFWKCWNSLFAIMLQPEARTFYFDALGAEYECFFKQNQVSKFDILQSGKVWCEFSIVLTFISYRPFSSYLLLATEDGYLVVTEGESENIIIRR